MARLVLTQADRHLRDQFKLNRWLGSNVARRRLYFEWCQKVIEQLEGVTGGDEPRDDAVITCIMAALSQDGTFSDFVARSENAAVLATDQGWRDVTHAGAAEILREYVVAREKGDWPEASQ